MEITDYDAFTEQLVGSLRADPAVLGLVALGSMAGLDVKPDEWSDHDFFVVVEDGHQEDFRRRFEWLPRPDDLIYAFRETEHGVKVLYEFGHLLEYAVFSLDELHLARVNRYKVLLDNGPVAERMGHVALESIQKLEAETRETPWLFGQFLTNLYVGVGRFRRGEVVSAHQFVKSYGAENLLRLIARYLPAEEPDLLDNLNPTRRFERVYPVLGAEINGLLLKPVPECAMGLLTVCIRELADYMPGYPVEAVTVVRDYIRP